jgi:hypothetical protein
MGWPAGCLGLLPLNAAAFTRPPESKVRKCARHIAARPRRKLFIRRLMRLF